VVTGALQAPLPCQTLRTEAFKTQKAITHDPVEEAAARIPQHQRIQRSHHLSTPASGLGFDLASCERFADVHSHALHHLDVR